MTAVVIARRYPRKNQPIAKEPGTETFIEKLPEKDACEFDAILGTLLLG